MAYRYSWLFHISTKSVLAVKFGLWLFFFSFLFFFYFFSQQNWKNVSLRPSLLLYVYMYTFLCLFDGCSCLYSHTTAFYDMKIVMWCLQFEMVMNRWTSMRLDFYLYFIKTEYIDKLFTLCALCIIFIDYYYYCYRFYFRHFAPLTVSHQCYTVSIFPPFTIGNWFMSFHFHFHFSPIFWNVKTFCHTSYSRT